MVLQPQTPTILINGSGDSARDYAHFRAGLRVFPALELRVSGRSVPGESTSVSSPPTHLPLPLTGLASPLDRVVVEAGLVRGVGIPGSEPGPRAAVASGCRRRGVAAAIRYPRCRHSRRSDPLRLGPRAQLREGEWSDTLTPRYPPPPHARLIY